jgi:hypothetical protein
MSNVSNVAVSLRGCIVGWRHFSHDGIESTKSHSRSNGPFKRSDTCISVRAYENRSVRILLCTCLLLFLICIYFVARTYWCVNRFDVGDTNRVYQQVYDIALHRNWEMVFGNEIAISAFLHHLVDSPFQMQCVRSVSV